MFTLKLRDFLKGLIMAIGTPVLYMLQELIPNWNLGPVEKAALSATVTYLLKNLFTDDIKAAQKTLSNAKIEGNEAAKPIPPSIAPGDAEQQNNK